MSVSKREQTGDVPADVEATDGAQHPSPIQVWVVDDNDCIREEVVKLLGRQAGITCQRDFDSPNAVLSVLASKPGPDVILLDIQMGEFSGLDAVRPIRSLSRSTRVLMFTTFFDHEARQCALAEGASGFLLKHDPAEEVVAHIRRAWAQPAPAVRRRIQPPNAPARGKGCSATEGLLPKPRLATTSDHPATPQVIRRFLGRCTGLFLNQRN